MKDKNENSLGDNKSLPKEFYYIENGMVVFTEAYHRNRGFCCKNGCRHCPYGFKKS